MPVTHLFPYENRLGYSDSKHAHKCIHSHSIFKLSYPTWTSRILGPTSKEVSWILQFFCILQRKNWLAIARGKPNWPPGDTRRRIQRHYCHTALTHPHSRYDNWETKHILHAPSQPRHILQSKAFSIWYGFNGSTGAEHRETELSRELNCFWELSDSHLNCMRNCEAEEDWRKKTMMPKTNSH